MHGGQQIGQNVEIQKKINLQKKLIYNRYNKNNITYRNS